MHLTEEQLDMIIPLVSFTNGKLIVEGIYSPKVIRFAIKDKEISNYLKKQICDFLGYKIVYEGPWKTTFWDMNDEYRAFHIFYNYRGTAPEQEFDYDNRKIKLKCL